MRRFAVVLALLALTLAACASEDVEPDASDSPSQEALSIEEPSDGAEVEVPFTVTFSSDRDLGPADSGASHVHLWIDGEEDDYEVIEGAEFEIKKLSPGEHTISVSLRNADHSAAGAEDQINVTVAGDAG